MNSLLLLSSQMQVCRHLAMYMLRNCLQTEDLLNKRKALLEKKIEAEQTKIKDYMKAKNKKGTPLLPCLSLLASTVRGECGLTPGCLQRP